MTVPPATVVRESCVFTAMDAPSLIKTLIAATKTRALEIAAREGITRPHFSDVYAPVSEDDLEGTIGRPCAHNWRDALCECHWGRYAQYTAIVRNQDYCDYLDTQRA